MKSARVVTGIVSILVLSAFAMSARAADKVFQLFVSTYDANSNSLAATIPTGANVWALLDFANQTPTTFNSVFKSVQITVPAEVTYAVAKVQTVNNGSCSTTMPSSMPTPGTPGTTFTINNLQGVKPSGHLCVYMAVTTTVSSCSAGTWQGWANTGSNFGGGTPFTDLNTGLVYSNATTNDGCTGVVGCISTGTQLNNYYSVTGPSDFRWDPDSSTTAFPGNGWGLRRGANKDAATCQLIPFNFTTGNVVVSGVNSNAVPFAKLQAPNPAMTGQQATWKYVIVWPTQSPDSTGWFTYRPRVSWGLPSASSDNDFIPGIPCLNDPGDLTQRNPAGLKALLPVIPNDCDPTANSHPVATDGPFCQAHYAHPDIYFLNDPNNPAKVCVSQHGWSTGPAGQVTPWDEFVDEEDTIILGR